MPTNVAKIDSNVTGLRYAEEASIKVLPGSPVWHPLEPNSYSDFGGQVTTIARNPINSGRKRKKGVVTDLDASGGFNTDLTQTNLQELMQGFFFADLRRKVEFGGDSELTGVSGTDTFEAASGLDVFNVGDIVMGSGFTNAANNTIHVVSAVSGTALGVGTTLVNETPPAGATLVLVGVESATGDIDVSANGSTSLPALTSTTLDFTTLGLIPGEFVYVGGDATAAKFGTAANNGFARVRSVAANILTFDKTEATMVTETNTTLGIQLFFGRVIRDETGALITRRTYNLERTLGVSDTTEPTEIQSEYLTGSVPNELNFVFGTADKLNVDLSFVSSDWETRTGAVGVKSGTRPALVESDAFNSTSNVPRVKLAQFSDADSAPTSLFAFAETFNISVNNNVAPNKAIGVLGSFDNTAGTFEVGGDMSVYFADVAAANAVRNNADITLEAHVVKNNAGVSFDLPLITLGDGRLNVSQDEAIKLPVSNQAATGAGVVSTMDHTLLMVFWDYLPDAAE